MQLKHMILSSMIFTACASASFADNTSIERKVDCLIEFTALQGVLTVQRSNGENVSYSEISQLDAYIKKLGVKIADQIIETKKDQAGTYISNMRTSMNLRMEGLARQIKNTGVATASTVVNMRTDECFTELGSMS